MDIVKINESESKAILSKLKAKIPKEWIYNPFISMELISEQQTQLVLNCCITFLNEYKEHSLEELRYDYYSSVKTSDLKYRPVPDRDINTSAETKHNNICAMLEYEKYSPEELRFNDYKYVLKSILIQTVKNPSIAQPDKPENNTHEEINSVKTSDFKYKPILGVDIPAWAVQPFVETKYIHICAMLEYEKYSPEELRLNDYKHGLKHVVNEKPIAQPDKSEKNVNEERNMVICPICLECIFKLKNNGTGVVSTICGHIMCKPCFVVIIKQGPKNKKTQSDRFNCPTCRKNLAKAQCHDIFL